MSQVKPEQTVEVPACGRCRKPIVDPAYMRVMGCVVLQKFYDSGPALYKSKEHADNYSRHINMHCDCFMATLRDHGVELHDMSKILTQMQQKAASEKTPQKHRKHK